MPRVTPIATKEDFEEKVKKAEASKLVVVDFFVHHASTSRRRLKQ